jgi:hypothetical protein
LKKVPKVVYKPPLNQFELLNLEHELVDPTELAVEEPVMEEPAV